MHTLLIQHFTARNLLHRKSCIKDFHGSTMDKNLPASGGDVDLIPESGRSPGEGNGNPLQYSHLGNSMDRGAWWSTVHEVTE